jgi:hypothetical protein
MRGETRLLASLYAYGNAQHVLPGLDATLLDVRIDHLPLIVSPRLALWLQPRDQLYFSRGVTPGGLAAVRVAWPAWQRVQPWLEVEAKTEGWVPGIVQLTGNVSVRTGLSAALF